MARILVIDDEASVRLTIKTILESRGHQVVLAETGHRGIAITEIYAFDIVIVDIFMPGMNGLDTIKVLRRCEPKVKIIAISGYSFRASAATPAPDFFRMAVDLGASCCLHKPFRATELIEAIDKQSFPLRTARKSA